MSNITKITETERLAVELENESVALKRSLERHLNKIIGIVMTPGHEQGLLDSLDQPAQRLLAFAGLCAAAYAAFPDGSFPELNPSIHHINADDSVAFLAPNPQPITDPQSQQALPGDYSEL